ncbi:MAG: PA2779 family protein [Sulfuricurvum sp.]|uniref:PA2779 family protein n=1 Tax=Sulfuricurvum sp. TaxID=2025608 RepID=UPI0026184246|nr:PA2779 family protein [Sulfuricurvum sp.]MDD5160118.1 PA2779 family protein [Sulfuricurvum sp.]
MKMSKVILSFVLSITLFAQVSWAQMASTEAVLEQPVSVSSHEKVSQFVAREDVAKTFESMGVDPKMVEQRIALMSDEEVSKISSQIDTLPAGGDFGGIVGAVVFVFIVLLITDILGLTKVFGFTRSVR